MTNSEYIPDSRQQIGVEVAVLNEVCKVLRKKTGASVFPQTNKQKHSNQKSALQE